MADNIQVVIVWMDGPNSLCSLNWDDGKGPVRIYAKDRYDPRLDLGRDREWAGPLPYFRTSREAVAWMLANRNAQCQLHIGAAGALGLLTCDT